MGSCKNQVNIKKKLFSIAYSLPSRGLQKDASGPLRENAAENASKGVCIISLHSTINAFTIHGLVGRRVLHALL